MSFTTAQHQKTPNVKGISLTIGVHAALVATYFAMPGITFPERFTEALPTWNIPLEPPPVIEKKPLPPANDPKPAEQKLTVPKSQVPDLPAAPETPLTGFTEADTALATGTGIGDIRVPIEPLPDLKPLPEPVITAPKLNSRYAGNFQPDYPSGQLRLGTEGIVSVRVLVGTNGRAKQIELVSAPHDDFWKATKRQALKYWRFDPATKDGTPYESWLTLKVRFQID